MADLKITREVDGNERWSIVMHRRFGLWRCMIVLPTGAFVRATPPRFGFQSALRTAREIADMLTERNRVEQTCTQPGEQRRG